MGRLLPVPVNTCRYGSILSLLALFLLLFAARAGAQQATVTESLRVFRTYPFSDPDPVARGSKIYPFFRFQGYSATPSERAWRIITLENPYIRVDIAPEIGGKILGAVEKSSGRAFIYYNRVVKFREIAMRGPWTSGGIEFNFGDIGHAPTTATPVDYVTRKNDDGSVSCIVGALDLPSRTEWRVEIRLAPDRAAFETRSFWYNPMELSTSRYHWMNAAAAADSTLQVIYPGTAYIGHGDEPPAPWPIDREGRDLSWYRNNAFGSYKSYHVLGSATDFFGARWGDLGVLHWSRYADKPGKKLWIWGLSREGEIWKGLLTDSALGNTQYVELQSGLHFNQAMIQSSRTPFKHMTFLPNTSERFGEWWFPFTGLGSVTSASPEGALDVRRSGDQLLVRFCPTAPFRGAIDIFDAEGRVGGRRARLAPLEAVECSARLRSPVHPFRVVVGGPSGNPALVYSSEDDSLRVLQRPLSSAEPFDWRSAYGRMVEGKELARQRDYRGAMASFRASLGREPALLPSLTGAAELFCRSMEYDSARIYAQRALSQDAYDAEANYLYGVAQRHLGRPFDARDGFGIAGRSPAFRSAAYLQLAEMAFLDAQRAEAEEYASRVLSEDADNIPARKLLALLYRQERDTVRAARMLGAIEERDPLSHFVRCERMLLGRQEHAQTFVAMIRTELPQEAFLEIAAYYMRLGRMNDIESVLTLAPRLPMVDLWRAYAASVLSRQEKAAGLQERAAVLLDHALAASPRLVFPHRQEEMAVLSWAAGAIPPHDARRWKVDYYRALLCAGLGRDEEATAHYRACGDRPDFAPFYLSRAAFLAADSTGALRDCSRAIAVDPNEWRGSLMLATLLNARGQHRDALNVAEHGVSRFPSSYVLTFLLARTLLFTGDYAQSLSILDTLCILPFEGARYGREAYRQACVLSAAEQMRRGKNQDALRLLAKARLWPERLGAGRPYDVDERLEDLLEATARRAIGDRKGEAGLLAGIEDYTEKTARKEGALTLLAALALRMQGKQRSGEALLKSWAARDRHNGTARWALMVYDGQRSQARAMEHQHRSTLFNRADGDQELVLLADVARTLGW